jgi:phosphatidylinositol-3-phosphatase
MGFGKFVGAALCLALIATPAAAKKAKLPKPDRIIIVMEENHSYADIIGNPQAPYINGLAQAGALFTDSHAVTHPSQPNYLELFSGSTQGVKDDSCPHSFSVDSEASQLIAAGKSFVGYSEGLPAEGSEVCTYGKYARKHAPWTNFTNLPATTNEPWTAFPAKLKKLPTVSWVIPNLLDDMHDGTIAQGDTWLKNNIASYVTWAMTHNSLLIVTWDEDDGSQSNQIPTIFIGPMVKQGQYSEHITHDTVLATIEAMYGLAPLGNAANVKPIKDVWQ